MKFIDPQRDDWHAVIGEDGPIDTPSPREHSLLTLAQWHAVRENWPRTMRVGLALDNTADAESLKPDLPRIALITLAFPKWTDGRAYSQARLLRARLRFAGELRATGEVLVDMLPLLHRTGFDAVQLRRDQSLDSAQRALRFFAGHYQGDAVQHQPVFGRDIGAELAAELARRRREADSFAGEGI